jgi:hypothetical protein
MMATANADARQCCRKELNAKLYAIECKLALFDAVKLAEGNCLEGGTQALTDWS